MIFSCKKCNAQNRLPTTGAVSDYGKPKCGKCGSYLFPDPTENQDSNRTKSQKLRSKKPLGKVNPSNNKKEEQFQFSDDEKLTENSTAAFTSTNGIRIIKSEEEISKIFNSEKPMPSNTLNTEGYKSLGYECGCGQFHGVNAPGIEKVACYYPVAFMFKCSSHYTKVEIKGWLRQQCYSIYSFEIKFFDQFLKDRNLK